MILLQKAAFLLVFSATVAAAADPVLLNLAMPDARLIVGINVEQAKLSPFGQSVLARMQKEDEGFTEFIQATGFDPRRDLREVVIASTGTEKNSALMLARGFFDVAPLTDFAKLRGATITSFQGIDIVSNVAKGDKGAVAFLDSTTAVAGDPELVRAAIERRSTAGGLSPALQTKIRELSTRNDAWFTSTLKGPELAGRIRDSRAGGIAKGDMLQAIEQSSGGVKFGEMVQLTGEAQMRSDQDATALADVARFLATMVQVNRDKAGAPGVATLIDQLDVRTEANIVKFSLAVPQGQLEKLMAPRTRRSAQR